MTKPHPNTIPGVLPHDSPRHQQARWGGALWLPFTAAKQGELNTRRYWEKYYPLQQDGDDNE